MAQYLLPRHVHVCQRGDDFVFLDLQRDEYTLVSGEAAAALRALATQRAAAPEPPAPLREVIEGGLLTTDTTTGRAIATTRVDVALEPLLHVAAQPAPRVRLHHVARFLIACLVAKAKLRWQHIENTVAAVERRKARHAQAPCPDMAKARELTAVFGALRSFFPFDYLCLYDSLALIEFLARYRIYPTWVFGVKLEPWAAHCWVQEGGFSFNEDVETAAAYTPIMTV